MKSHKSFLSKLTSKCFFRNLHLPGTSKPPKMTIQMAETCVPEEGGSSRRGSEFGASNSLDDPPTSDPNGIHQLDDKDSDCTYRTASSGEAEFYLDDQNHFHNEPKRLTKSHSNTSEDSVASIQSEVIVSAVPTPAVGNMKIQTNKADNQVVPINTLPPKSPTTDTKSQQVTPKPNSEYSASTKQFLDLLDLATGKRPVSGYSVLKDRIGTLMRNANRKKWTTSHGPRWTGLGVNTIVHNVETRNKKSPEPELLKRGPFVAKKSSAPTIAEVKKHAGKWQQEVARDKYANIPQPSLADDLRSHINSILKTPLRYTKKPTAKMIESKPLPLSTYENDDDDDLPHKPKPIRARLTVTSLCEHVDDGGFNFEDMTDLEKMVNGDMSEEETQNLLRETFPSVRIDKNAIEETYEEETMREYEHDAIERQVSEQQPMGEDKLEEDEAETAEAEPIISATSINEILATQLERSLSDPEGNQYFLEEECVMLSPYSNEAKLYKLLFPGTKIPIKSEEVNEAVQCSIEESASEFVPNLQLEVETCVETIVDAEEVMECVQVDTLPVLTSPYTDDMWVTESEIEVEEVPEPEIVREPTPVPEPEPEPEPPQIEPEPEPEPPPPEPEPEPEPDPPKPVKRVKRKRPEKKKKVYDRNFVKAVQMNQVDTIQELLYEGADPDTSCSIGTVLHQAVQLGFSFAVQTLLWGGSNTEIRNELGDTALHLATISGHNDIVLMLIGHGCDLDACNNYDITPLHMALAYGRLDIIQTLVRMNADPHSPDRIGDSPLVVAKQLGYHKDVLNPASAEIGPVKDIPAPLHLVHAVENNDLQQVRQSLNQKASPDTIVPLTLHWPGHSTVLHRAAHLGLTGIVRELLSTGANVNARDMVGNTPLHTAVQDGHNDVVSVLVEGGADLNAATQSGVTPLHRAASKGHQSTMMLLLKSGASATSKDHQNRTPLEWARQKGYMVMARGLLPYMS